MCICMTLISIFVVAIITIQFTCPAVVPIYKEWKGEREREQYSYIEVRMIYARHV